MTLNKAIDRIDTLKPGNGMDREIKIEWLSILDRRVKEEIIDRHEGGEAVVWRGYDETTPGETELLIPSPYETVYYYWLEAQIDYWNGEFNQYNNAITMYNAEYAEFAAAYRRNHRPLSLRLKFW